MDFHSYIVAADFHTRADAIEAMKQVVAEVTPPSLDEEGCQIYHWSQGADDPTLFLLYMEWRDKACFKTHIATPHVKYAEDRLKREKMLIEPAERMAFPSTYRQPTGPWLQKTLESMRIVQIILGCRVEAKNGRIPPSEILWNLNFGGPVRVGSAR